MRKWIVAAGLIIVTGIATTWWQLRVPVEGRRANTKAEEGRPDTDRAESKPSEADAEEDDAPTLQRPPRGSRSAFPPPTPPPAGKWGPYPATEPGRFPGSDGALASASMQRKLIREGTRLIDVRGTLKRQGNRHEFVRQEGGSPIVLLENQLLERIELLLGRQREGEGTTAWLVSGLVTEYRGANYLLLERAQLMREAGSPSSK